MSADETGCGPYVGLALLVLGLVGGATGLAISIELSPVIHIAACSAHQAALGNCDQFIHNVTGWRGVIRVLSVIGGVLVAWTGYLLMG